MSNKIWPRFIICLCLLVVLVPGMTAMAAAPTVTSLSAQPDLTDTDGHWAEDTIIKWVNQGWIHGYTDGTFKPNATITRAEFVTLINKAFGYIEGAEKLPFTDLPAAHWAYKEISAAYKADYFHGADGKANADQRTTRQEGAVMLANVLAINPAANGDLSKYKDGNLVASWAKGALSELSAKQIFKGDPSGKLRPADTLTRAEAVTIIDAAKTQEATVFDKAGEYGSATETQTIQGDVVISVAGVTLNNMIINGNLLLDKGIGEGDVYLNKVRVKGKTVVQGGGEHSVHALDSVFVQIIVDKVTGKVRIVASGTTTVQTIVVNTPVKIEASDLTTGTINAVELSNSLPSNSTVDLVGQFEDVRILATTIQVNLPSGSIDHLEVGKDASGNKINVSSGASVEELVLNAVANFVGTGKILSATVNESAKGSKFETKPEKVDGAGQDRADEVIVGGGGGSGGSGPGGGDIPSNTGDQTTAYLSSVSVGGNLSLVARDEFGDISAGFNKEAYEYTVTTARNMEAAVIPIAVVPESDAEKVKYMVDYIDQEDEASQVLSSNHSFNVNVKPLEDVHITIDTTSGDGKTQKSYVIHIQYKRTLQETFMIESKMNYDELDGSNYLLTSNRILERGDVVNIYGSSLSQNPLDTTTVIFDGYYDSYINDWAPGYGYELQQQGQFYITVTRNGQIVDQGNYTYDLTEMNRINSSEGISVQQFTKEELIGQWGGVPGAVHLQLDPTKWTGGPLATAKYYRAYLLNTHVTYQDSPAPLQAENRGDFVPTFFNLPPVSENERVLAYTADLPGIITDSYLQIVFLDGNRNPIGYYETTIIPDANHLTDGYAIKHTIDPTLNTGDAEPPVLKIGDQITSARVGEEIYVNVSETANVYLVPSNTELNGRSIHDLVVSGGGSGAISLVKGGYNPIDTTGLSAGDWEFVAVDESGNLSLPVPIKLIGQDEALIFDSITMGYNNSIRINFDSDVVNYYGNMMEFRDAITVSRDGGETYQPLSVNDTVTVYSNFIEIVFEKPYTGANNKIKIAANSLATSYGVVLDREFISPSFAAGPTLTMTSPEGVHIGENITFSVEQPGKVYLMSFADFRYKDKSIAEGKGKVVTVNEDQVNIIQSLSTSGLPSGQYMLFIVDGEQESLFLLN